MAAAESPSAARKLSLVCVLLLEKFAGSLRAGYVPLLCGLSLR